MYVRAIVILNRLRINLALLLVLSVSFADYAHTESQFHPSENTHNKFNSLNYEGDRLAQSLFTESIHVLGGARNPIARWHGPIHLAVIGATDEFLRSQILPIFNEISLLSGIRYRVIRHDFVTADQYAQLLGTTPPYDLSLCDKSEPQYCANFVVIISGRGPIRDIASSLPLRPVFQKATLTAHETNAHETLCFFSPGITREREIVRSLVYVPVDLEPSMKSTCLHEEIYQSFGLFGDYTDSYYFSFNNRVEPKAITRYDKWLLTSLYDRSIARTAYSAQVAQQLVSYCQSKC